MSPLRCLLTLLCSTTLVLAQDPAPLPPSQDPSSTQPGGKPPTSPPPRPPGDPSVPEGSQPPASAAAAPTVVKPDEKPSVVRVNVTNQAWDFARPWGKRPPYSRRGIGAVISGKRVLVTGELVANANYLELETPEGGQKVPASVEIVDYEANLAIVKAEDDKFMEKFEPFELTTAKVGDTVEVWQLETTGTVLVTKGGITSAEVSRYPVDESPLLVYRATVSLQFRDSSFTLPVVKDDKLVGIIMRYDNSGKSAEMVSSPVIKHFLKDAAELPYEGFPRAGMAFSNTRDPGLRRFVGLDDRTPGGVYVTEVLKDGPAAKAGLAKGDVILKIAGHAVDQDGNYSDQDYGKTSIVHLLGAKHFDGETVPFTIRRKGETKELKIEVKHREREDFTIEPYVIDRAPRFYVLGGLVLQELSRQYLKEWGNDWMKKAPEEFVFFDRQQSELFKNGPKKIVFLSSVLPSPVTIGYEELQHLVVKKINDVPLQSLSDIPAALAAVKNNLHKIEFDGDPTFIYLDSSAVAAGEATLMKNYRIPTLHRLN